MTISKPHSLTAKGRPLVSFRGRVISVADRITHHRGMGRHSHSTISSLPEVWIADASGCELPFRDETLDHCRAGHEIVIIGDRGADRVLAMRNLSTTETWFSPTVSTLPVNGAHVSTIIFTCFSLACMTWFITMILFGEPSVRDSVWEDIGRTSCYLIAVAVGCWGPEKARTYANERTATLRAQIEATIEEAIK